MFSCLQILEAFLWFVLITLLNVTLIILTLSVSRSEERFSRNAGTDLVCRLLLEKKKRGPRADGAYIRTAANVHQVACLTTVAAARAAAAGIADWTAHDLQVRSLQEFHEEGQQRLPL